MTSKRSTMRNRNPFAVDPLPKAYYHPSPERALNKTEKSISIKPSSSTDDAEINNEEDDKISPLDEMFLRGTNMYQTKPSRPNDTDDEVNFDESWPCSERPSSVSLNGYEDDSQFQLHEYLCRIDNLIGTKPNSDPNMDKASLQERRRMPGSASQGTGVTASRDTGKPFKSKIPVKDTGQGGRPSGMQPDVNTETDGSVLQRFRNSAPMSREEREGKSQPSSQDFWWLSNGAPPTEVRERKRERKEEEIPGPSSTTPLTTVNLEKYKQLQKLAEKQGFSNHIPESPGDKRTIDLQERAEKLLERSSSTVLSTDPAVSTEGLGSNTSDMSSLEEYTYRPKFANYLDSKTEQQKYANPPLFGQRPQSDNAGYQPSMPGQRPPTVDDPLHQWRLRRRMELAQQSTPQHTPQFDFINKTEQQKKIDEKLKEFKQRLSGRAPAHSQFTPAPAVQHREQSSQPGDRGRFHEPQIASPSLHPPRPITEPVEEVDPHLHLMCDLLPCPHRGQIQGTSPQGTSSGSKNNFRDNLDTRDNASSSEKEENDKMSAYKQYLEAEKPDIEKAGRETDHVNEHEGNPDWQPGLRSIQEIENMVKDIGAENSDGQASPRPDKENDKGSQKSDRQGKAVKDGKKSSPDSECSQTNSKHLVEEHPKRDEGHVEVKDKKEKVLKPKHSSSPKNKRRGVSETIGQVVKEHLFSTSTSTVLSSVDSLPPSASVDKLPWKHKPPSHDQSHDQCNNNKLEHNEVPYESDEDFSEDNLLQMLRRQRSQYEQQLQEIDNMLMKLEDS
ncbi:uncharacterized protein LOC132759772 isoform X2 [Ruditapes philippinarum]|uniref:uncharacterized protein LOC132759772 isoform X2 n=1 Tax=Ruditapes philippinarum TaxID=129788 RepID=UPI00295BB3CA|nr:uncharacterized protein LOC132759772 isoform X2 [Ruditapes philippinarum]